MPDDPPPKVTIYDAEEVQKIFDRAATAYSFDLSLGNQWESDDSIASYFVWGAKHINPFQLIGNVIRYGQATVPTSGALATTLDSKRRVALRTEFLQDFPRIFNSRLSTQGPKAALDYLNILDLGTKRCWENIAWRFKATRQVNNQINQLLNDGIDTAYRIRVAASVAFVVVGSLPAGALTAVGVAGAAATPWWVVALIGGAYGFLAEISFDRADILQSKTASYPVTDAGKAGVMGAAGNAAQKGLEAIRLRQAQILASNANISAAQGALSRSMNQIQSNVAGHELHRVVQHEGQRRLSDYYRQKAAENLATKSKWVKGTGAGLCIAVSLYMMKDEIKEAVGGLTAGIDRTR